MRQAQSLGWSMAGFGTAGGFVCSSSHEKKPSGSSSFWMPKNPGSNRDPSETARTAPRGIRNDPTEGINEALTDDDDVFAWVWVSRSEQVWVLGSEKVKVWVLGSEKVKVWVLGSE
jgi:hypothetical protein